MADDIIASARSMTTAVDGQYVTVGLPKGGLTPATITAMVGMAQGEGLQVNPLVTQAISKLQGDVTGIIGGLPAGAASALANANITTGNVLASSNVSATVTGIKDALAADGIMLDTATETSLTQNLSAATALSSISSKVMAGGPAGFMSKFNQARAHIADATELKKVTAFTANMSLDKFGSGMKSMTSLSMNGLDGVMGNMTAAGAAFAAAGPLFDMKDMKNFGSPVGMIKKLMSSKMSNATGVTAKLAAQGVDINDLENPAHADKISKVMNGIKDPNILKSVTSQFNVNPAAGLLDVKNPSLTSGVMAAAKANPFGGLPGYSGADSSLNAGAASTMLGGQTTYSVNAEPPAALQATADSLKAAASALTVGGAGTQKEPSANPVAWGATNNEDAFAKTAVKARPVDEIIKKIVALFESVVKNVNIVSDSAVATIDGYYAIDVNAPDAEEQLKTVTDTLRSKYGDIIAAAQKAAFADANAAGKLIMTMPQSTNAEKTELNYYSDQRNGTIESLLRASDAQVRNAIDARKLVKEKIAAAKTATTST